MTTLVIPTGRRIYNGGTALADAGVTIFDAETNDPFFLADWLAWLAATQSSTSRPAGWAYPCQIDAAADGWILQGGRFYGNIPRTQNRTGTGGFYTGGAPQRFNSALLHLRLSARGSIVDTAFGVLGDLDSGFCDGVRAALLTTRELNFLRCTFGNARDDCIEADVSPAPLNVTDCFFEDVYSWISATGNGNPMTSKRITVRNSLCRFRAWPEQGGASQIGPVFKIDGASNAPVFDMRNVTLHIPNSWPEIQYNRTRGALSRMLVNNCDLLVTGGQLSNEFGLRDAFIAAGWNLIENTTQANAIWAERRAAYFAQTPPPPAPSLTSPATLKMNGAP